MAICLSLYGVLAHTFPNYITLLYNPPGLFRNAVFADNLPANLSYRPLHPRYLGKCPISYPVCWSFQLGCRQHLKTMSTGAPLLSVDLTPPSNELNHNHGHSRSRGHSRSNRWAQPPPPLSQPGNVSFPEHPEPINAVNSSYSYGHTHQASSQGHHAHSHSRSHSHSNAHHNHNHSVSSLHHDVLDDHHSKDSNGVYGMLSTDTTIKANYSSEKTYVG